VIPPGALAVDVGATSIRMCLFAAAGALIGRRSRRPTPYPCTPERLIAVVSARFAQRPLARIGLGFPGDVRDGVVLDAANLTRPEGPGGARDPALAERWRGYDLRGSLAAATGAEVHVDNDAAMAALGCATGAGTELVVTLGTGCGLALVRDGELVRVRDVGDERLSGGETYDDVLGERGRQANEAEWTLRAVSAVSALAGEYEATTIHLAGGNARRLSPSAFGAWAGQVVIERDEPALRGAWRACYG
jgi:polyphosphate glucokinase